MGKGLTIWLVIILVLTILCDFVILKTNTYTGNTLEFSVSAGDDVRVTGAQTVVAKASTTGYFRIMAGSTFIESQAYTGNTHIGTGTLTTGKWDIRNGSSVVMNVVSETPLFVVVNPSVSSWTLTILVSLLLDAFLFFMGYFYATID